MFIRASQSIRLVGLTAAVALATVAVMSTCAGLAAFVMDPHRCCKAANHGAPATEEDCRTKCAESSGFVLPAGVAFETSQVNFAVALPTAAEPLPAVRPVLAFSTARERSPSLPIYQRNSALLI